MGIVKELMEIWLNEVCDRREISKEAEWFRDVAVETKKRACLCKHGLYIKLQ